MKNAGSEPLDDAAYTQQQVQWYNESPGKLTGYDCPACRNKGSIAFLQDGNITMQTCTCMKKRQALRNVQRSDLAANLERMKFRTYQCSEPWQTQAKEKAVDYCREKGAPWFYIAGQSGTGKTHLCTAIKANCYRWSVMSLLLKMVVSGINGYWYMELLSVATTYFVC